MKHYRSTHGYEVVVPDETQGKFAPSEHDEQVALFRWLRKNKILAHSIPNSGPGTSGKRMKEFVAEGLTKGVPDLYILDPTPDTGQFVAVEMKRQNGSEKDASPEQKHLLCALDARGWCAILGFGFRAVAEYLISRGYTNTENQ